MTGMMEGSLQMSVAYQVLTHTVPAFNARDRACAVLMFCVKRPARFAHPSLSMCSG